MSEMNYISILDNLLADMDLSTKNRKKKAYRLCFEYGEENFDSRTELNAFLAEAAKRLEQEPIFVDITEMVEPAGNEKLHLSYSDSSGPILTGNRAGLVYLAKILALLADSQAPHEHVHLYHDEFPMEGTTFPLTMYCEDEQWFDKNTREEEDEEEYEEEPIQERFIDPAKVVAVIIAEELPPVSTILSGKIYRVIGHESFAEQDIWIKMIREDDSRLHVFTLRNEDGQDEQIALDLDDETVVFLEQEDLEQLF